MASIRFALVVTLIGACGSSAPPLAKPAPSGLQCPSDCSQDAPEQQPVSPKPQQSFSVDTARVVVPVKQYMPNIRVYADDDEERLYWVDYMGTAGYMSLSDGHIEKLNVNTGELSLNSENFYVGSRHIFAASKELSAIVVANRDRAAIIKTIPTKVMVTDVAATTDRVYWIDGNGLSSVSIDGGGTPTIHSPAQERDMLDATPEHVLFKNQQQELHLLSNGEMQLIATDVAHFSVWKNDVFIVKSGGTRGEVHAIGHGGLDVFDLDAPTEKFAVGAGGICSLSGANITCYDHKSKKRILNYSVDPADTIQHLAVSQRMVFWSTSDKHEIWAAPLP